MRNNKLNKAIKKKKELKISIWTVKNNKKAPWLEKNNIFNILF